MATIAEFLKVYRIFESDILGRYPACRIVLENRAGSKHPHPFLISDVDSILELGKALQESDLRLEIALDIAQMFTRHFGSKRLVGEEGVDICAQLLPIKDKIRTLHLWGRGAMGGAHNGNLDGIFLPNSTSKHTCMALLNRILEGAGPKYLVVEVAGRRDRLDSILADLTAVGIQLV